MPSRGSIRRHPGTPTAGKPGAPAAPKTPPGLIEVNIWPHLLMNGHRLMHDYDDSSAETLESNPSLPGREVIDVHGSIYRQVAMVASLDAPCGDRCAGSRMRQPGTVDKYG